MGTTVRDFLNPEFVLIGSDRASGNGTVGDSRLRGFYRTLHDRPLFETDVKTAELIKVAYNTFIGQKIVFANAMMELCHKVGADADDLAAALGLAGDRIVSPRYLRGGMGDGGPCHPRDNIALSWLSAEAGLSHDIFGDVMRARESQTEWLADLIAERANGLPVVGLGKAFKPESDLAAGSPAGPPLAPHDPHAVLSHHPAQGPHLDAARHVRRESDRVSVVAHQVEAFGHGLEARSGGGHRPGKVVVVDAGRAERLVHAADDEG